VKIGGRARKRGCKIEGYVARKKMGGGYEAEGRGILATEREREREREREEEEEKEEKEEEEKRVKYDTLR